MPWEHCMELWQLELDFASLEILHCPGLDFTSSMAWTSRNPSLSIFTDTYFFAIKNFALQISLYYTLIDANTQRSFLIGRNSGGMSIFLPSSLVLLSYSTSWSIRWKNCSCCRDFVCTSPTRPVFPFNASSRAWTPCWHSLWPFGSNLVSFMLLPFFRLFTNIARSTLRHQSAPYRLLSVVHNNDYKKLGVPW